MTREYGAGSANPEIYYYKAESYPPINSVFYSRSRHTKKCRRQVFDIQRIIFLHTDKIGKKIIFGQTLNKLYSGPLVT